MAFCELEQVGPMAVCRVCGKAVLTYGSTEAAQPLCGGPGAFVVEPKAAAPARPKTIAPRRGKLGCGGCRKKLST